MQTSQWLYTSPVYPEALQLSEDHLLAAAAGPVVVVVDPSNLERRAWFAPPQGFSHASVESVDARPRDVDQSIRFSFETLKEFSMRDPNWSATVRSLAWSPRDPGFADGGCLLGAVSTDNKVLLYTMPTRRSRDRLEYVADLTERIREGLKDLEEWEATSDSTDDAESEEEEEDPPLRLRGGGRGRSRGASIEARRHIKRTDATSDIHLQTIQNFQFPREVDAVLAASLEEENDRRFRLDLPKVILASWLQLRSHFSEDALPKYKKGEFLFGIDRHIYDRVLDHIFGLYGTAMDRYKITKKHVETRSRALIRNKAIMSFGEDLGERGTTGRTSVLSLIGQAPPSEISSSHIKDMTVVSNDTAAVCIGASHRTLRIVKPRSGKKRKSTGNNKSRLISHFSDTIENRKYDRRLAILNVTCASWSPVLWGTTTFFALGNGAGHVILMKMDASCGDQTGNVTDRCRWMGVCPCSDREICSIKWTTIGLPDAVQSIVFVAVADVSGQVMLWTMHKECLKSDMGRLMQGGWQVHRSDLRPVSSMTLRTTTDRRLQICIGKCGGALSVWESPDVTSIDDDISEWFAEGRLYSRYNCHGNKVITGIVADLIEDWIVTVGLDGNIFVWKIQNNELARVHYRALHSSIGSGVEAFYGAASSPCGTMVAVLKDLGEKQIDAQEQRMIWKRIAHGSIELVSLVNFEDDWMWSSVEHHVRRSLDRIVDPLFVRSFGNLMRMTLTEDRGRNLSVEALEENETDDDIPLGDATSISADIDAQRRKQFKAQSLLQSMLDALTDSVRPSWHPSISEVEMQRLRAAVCLYYTVKDIPDIKLRTSSIKRAELTMMHHHSDAVLNGMKRLLPCTIVDAVLPLHCMKRDLWTAVLVTTAVWLFRFRDRVHPVLLRKAQTVIDDDPEVFAAVPDFTRDDPVEAGTIFDKAIDGGVMKYDRCPVTLIPMEELICSPWKCDTCDRRCLTPRQWLMEVKGMSNPDCMFCGTPLHQ